MNDVNVWVAGASRLARLELEGPPGTSLEGSFRHLAVGASGPLLANFALWTLERAATGDIQRLFFPSPRCDVAFWVTSQVVEFLDLPINLRQIDGGWSDWQGVTPEALAEVRSSGAQVSEQTFESLLAAGVGNAEGDAVVGILAKGAAIEGLHRVLTHLGRRSVQGCFLEAEDLSYDSGRRGSPVFLPPRLRGAARQHEVALLGAVTMSDPIEHSAALLAAEGSSVFVGDDAASDRCRRARQQALRVFLDRLLPQLRRVHLQTPDPEAMRAVLELLSRSSRRNAILDLSHRALR